MSINTKKGFRQINVCFLIFFQVGHDPEAGRYKRVKEEEERLRSDLRKESMVKRTKERGQHSRLSSGYLEGGDSDDEGGVSIAAIKNKYKKKKAGGQKTAYSTDELSDDSDIEAKKAKKLENAKNALRDSDEDSAASKRSRSPRRSRSRSGSRSNSASSRGSAAARSRSGSPRSKSGSPRSGSGSD